jgi:hypothetical protein
VRTFLVDGWVSICSGRFFFADTAVLVLYKMGSMIDCC